MNKQYFDQLFTKYLSDELTEAEFTILWETLQQPEYEQQWKKVTEEVWNKKEKKIFPNDAIRRRILNRIEPDLFVYPRLAQQPSIWKKQSMWRAAAAILVLLSGSTYFFINSRNNDGAAIARQEPPAQPAIQPGDNKAVLTLHNGQKLILDNAAPGVLATEGGTEIEKKQEGQLIYHSGNHSNGPLAYNTIETPRGGQYQIILPDGTGVWLNAASSIRYPVTFSGNERTVSITGEAYFEVARDEKKPFRVVSGTSTVEVLGTHFNIQHYDGEVPTTTLLEGAIQLISNGRKTPLKPGQQASIDQYQTVRVTDNANLEEAVAWKNGLFLFNRVDIESIMRQAGRWYNIEVEYTSKCQASFSGEIARSAAIEDFLAIMSETEKVKFEIKGHKIIVTPL